MRKPKNTELNFLYLDEQYQNKKKTKKEKDKPKVSKDTKKVSKKRKRADEGSAQEKRETFNFDNEIVIGVTKIPKADKNSKTKKKKKTEDRKPKNNKTEETKNAKNKLVSGTQKSSKAQKSGKVKEQESKSKAITKKIIKWTILLSALMAASVFFMMSPLFDIAQIEVKGNEKIETDRIISLSKIEYGENIYKTSKKQIEKNVKENAYIQSVNVKRNLPNKIVLQVKERKTTYMLEYANSYVYINNQGYILEVSEEKQEVPIITGYTTKLEELKEGSRLCDEDLEKLEMVLRIMESANGNGIGNLITRINIQDKQNYILIMEEKKKTIYLGNASNLSNRMMYLKAILIGEEGIEGEIFVNGDLNNQNAFFRKKE